MGFGLGEPNFFPDASRVAGRFRRIGTDSDSVWESSRDLALGGRSGTQSGSTDRACLGRRFGKMTEKHRSGEKRPNDSADRVARRGTTDRFVFEKVRARQKQLVVK